MQPAGGVGLKPFNVVMVEPEIPQNTGNVARLCAATGSRLHLVRPLGFLLSDRHMQRAGLDYWQHLDLTVHDSLQDFLDHSRQEGGALYLMTTSGRKAYHEARFVQGDWLLLGSETRGLPHWLIERYAAGCLRIPMQPGRRCLNVSNSAAVVLYEALRQSGYPEMS